MREALKKLREFHTKQRFPLDHSVFKYRDEDATTELRNIATDMLTAAQLLEGLSKTNPDLRLRRAQLMVEELAETIAAFASCDEVELLDGLSDLLFVTLGTAASFDMPIEAGLHEVCDSNLTKNPRDDADHRLRNKGPDYRPPNMQRILERHRMTCTSCSHLRNKPQCHTECPNNV